MDARLREDKLAKLLEIEGYERIEDLIEAVFSDTVSPAICMNEDCNFTCEILRRVPHQHNGCRACSRGSHLMGPRCLSEMAVTLMIARELRKEISKRHKL
jgi:hypothetical protein